MFEECYRCGKKMEPPAYCHPCLRLESERGKAVTLQNIKLRALCLSAAQVLSRAIPTKHVNEALFLLNQILEEK